MVNANKSAVENSTPAGQVQNLTAICGFSQFGHPVIPGTGSSPCNREISIYVDPIGGVPSWAWQALRRFSRDCLPKD